MPVLVDGTSVCTALETSTVIQIEKKMVTIDDHSYLHLAPFTILRQTAIIGVQSEECKMTCSRFILHPKIYSLESLERLHVQPCSNFSSFVSGTFCLDGLLFFLYEDVNSVAIGGRGVGVDAAKCH